MARSDSDETRSVALYWDFENIHASLVDAVQGDGAYAKPDGRFRNQEPHVDVKSIVELASSFGPIAINRAYCNWQWFSRYRDALLQGAVELIQLFSPGPNAKNGADIKLCLDAVEDLGRFNHIGTVIIVGGDSDFMPVSQKVKAAGRTLIGIGTRKSTNKHWAKSCHEFKYYESLTAPAPAEVAPPGDPAPASQDGLTDDPEAPSEILRRAIQLLSEKSGDPWVRKGQAWHMIKRLDPTFSPADHGHANFSAMVKSQENNIEIRKGEHDQEIRIRG